MSDAHALAVARCDRPAALAGAHLRRWRAGRALRPTGSFNGAGRRLRSGSFETIRRSASTRRPATSSSSTKHHTARSSSSTEAGNPVNFSATGSPKLPVERPAKSSVDNSGGPTQGNFYVVPGACRSQGFAPSGRNARRAGRFPQEGRTRLSCTRSRSTPTADVWLRPTTAESYRRAWSTTPSGTPTGQTIQLVGCQITAPSAILPDVAFDSHKNVWYTVEDGSLIRHRRRAITTTPTNATTSAIRWPPVARDVGGRPVDRRRLLSNHGDRIEATRFTEPLRRPVDPFEVPPGTRTRRRMDFSGRRADHRSATRRPRRSTSSSGSFRESRNR